MFLYLSEELHCNQFLLFQNIQYYAIVHKRLQFCSSCKVVKNVWCLEYYLESRKHFDKIWLWKIKRPLLNIKMLKHDILKYFLFKKRVMSLTLMPVMILSKEVCPVQFTFNFGTTLSFFLIVSWATAMSSWSGVVEVQPLWRTQPVYSFLVVFCVCVFLQWRDKQGGKWHKGRDNLCQV